MPNPILPLWEYVPDGEPRVFGDRVYLYGSHDRAAGHAFCDFKLKVWSAPIDNLNSWQCHGDSFRTRDGARKSDTPWTTNELYAPDVIEKDGKYYLYAYIVGSKGAIGVSDRPEGPFKLLSQYVYGDEKVGDDGIFNDAGVLVDDDGRVYVYYGFEHSTMPFNDLLNEWMSLQGQNTKIVIGLAVYKSGTEDVYAKEGGKEWLENNNVISNQITNINNMDAFGWSYFSSSCLCKNINDIAETEKEKIIHTVNAIWKDYVT